jgi:hypothetical protein
MQYLNINFIQCKFWVKSFIQSEHYFHCKSAVLLLQILITKIIIICK